MNDLQIYVYSGEQLRTIQRDDGLWWVLRDVCRVLGIANQMCIRDRYISRRSPAYWPKSFFKNDPSLRMLGIGAVLQ